MRRTATFPLVFAAMLVIGVPASRATTIGETAAAGGIEHSLAGSGSMSASTLINRMKSTLSASSSHSGGGGADSKGAWKSSDGWARNGSSSRSATGQTWLAAGSWNNRSGR